MFSILNIFTSSSNSFRGQKPQEKTVLVVRRHWFWVLSPAIFAFLLALLPFLIYLFISSMPFYPAVSNFYWFLVSFHFLILWSAFFYMLMLYFLNAVIITDQRVIQNNQKGFFNYDMIEIKLEKIQDISVKIVGPIATFLDFGDLEIQTAGTQVKFHFNGLPQPQKIKDLIMDLAEKK